MTSVWSLGIFISHSWWAIIPIYWWAIIPTYAWYVVIAHYMVKFNLL
jgi:hypothetical protein